MVGAAAASGGEPPPKDEADLKEWIRNKLKALASLLGRLGIKAAEQGITIASILTAIGMAIGVLVKALLPGAAAASGGEPPPKDETGLKAWIRNKLKALASL